MEIYLDNAATTKPRKEVVQSMITALEQHYGNPSSLHRKGVEVEKQIKNCRKLLAKALECKEQEVYFTSGGTEANNIAIRGIVDANKRRGKHIITSKIEHVSVLDTFKDLEKQGYRVKYLDVHKDGFVNLSELESEISEDTVFASIMHVNNEVGCIQPIKKCSEIIKSRNPYAIFHVDGIQSFGKITLSVKELGVDSFSISAHKIHGPKGVGALYLKKGIKINPVMAGGGQEMGLRVGTENVPGIFGIGEATRYITDEYLQNIEKIKQLKLYLIELLENEINDIHINSPMKETFSPYILNVSFEGVKSEVLLHSLEGDEIYVSSGSACSSKKRGYSHVLLAMQMKKELINSAIRFSFSAFNSNEDINYAVEKIKTHVKILRAIMKR